MKYSLEWLRGKYEKGEKIDYLFFWGHTSKQHMAIGKQCFSQWFPSSFEYKGIRYGTAEHWMMAQKALLFNDKESFEKIVQEDSPVEAKKIGRLIKNFDIDIWDSKCYEIVRKGNELKFTQNEELKNFLLSTDDLIIVEASPVDTIWGIGLSQDSKDVQNPLEWRGLNLLGFALMEVRDSLRSKEYLL